MQRDLLLPTVRKVKKRFNYKSRDLTIQDKEIFAHANNLLRLFKMKKILTDIPFPHTPENIALVYYAFEKDVYNKEFSLFLSHYLSSLKPLMNVLPQNNSKETLIMLSHKLIFERHKRNHLLFRFGDTADKFYIILKGTVSIIIFKELEVKMTIEEYLAHLRRLRELKEVALMRKIMQINTSIFKESNVNYILSLDESEEERMIQRQNSLSFLKNCNNSNNNRNAIHDNNNTIQPSIIISAVDYIQNTFPKPFNSNNTNDCDTDYDNGHKKDITLLVYFNLCSLGIGKTFGDIALSNPNGLRTGSIICKEDSYLGSLTKTGYDSLVKDSQDKLRKAKLLTILSSPIFSGINVDQFIKKYFSYFKELELKQGAHLFSQGDEREEIFLIKEGEIDMTTRLSFNELTTIIQDKGGEIDNIKEKTLFYDLFIHDIPIQYKDKRSFKLFTLKDGEVCGLDDCLFENRYLCNAVCSSIRAIIYSIQYSMFQRLVEDEECIKINLPGFVKIKTEVLRKRMIALRNKEISNRVKKFKYSFSEENIFKPLNTNGNSLLLKQKIKSDFKLMKMKEGSHSRNTKAEINNALSKKEKPNALQTVYNFNKNNRVFKNLGVKRGKQKLMIEKKNIEENKVSCQSTPKNIPGITFENLILADSYIKNIINQIETEKKQSQSCSELNIQPSSNSNKKYQLKKLQNKKGLVLSYSYSSLIKKENKVSNTIIEKIINFGLKNKSYSKGLTNNLVEFNTNHAQYDDKTKCKSKDNLHTIKSYNYQPGVIDFLAMDKLYESSEPKRIKKRKPKVTLIPLNILLLKRYPIPSINNKRSSSVNDINQ